VSHYVKNIMTVSELRAVLATLPDDAPVLVSDEDHGYLLAKGTAYDVGRGLARGKTYFTEWHGNPNTKAGEHLVRALVVHG
jgi:hypothetical protein